MCCVHKTLHDSCKNDGISLRCIPASYSDRHFMVTWFSSMIIRRASSKFCSRRKLFPSASTCLQGQWSSPIRGNSMGKISGNYSLECGPPDLYLRFVRLGPLLLVIHGQRNNGGILIFASLPTSLALVREMKHAGTISRANARFHVLYFRSVEMNSMLPVSMSPRAVSIRTTTVFGTCTSIMLFLLIMLIALLIVASTGA